MSREIKFRAWNEEKGIMMLPGSVDLFIHFDGTLNHHDLGIVQGSSNTPQMTLMQYTGLQDKNGKGREIYEGDVYKQEGRHYVVEWSERTLGFVARSLKSGSVLPGYLQGEIAVYDDYEYIGSIHEHPHLLGEKGEGQG